jgi:hypothetical protein
LWNVKNTKKATYTLPGHEDEVYALDWYYIYIKFLTISLLILILIGVLLVSLSLLVVKIELLKYGEIR